MLTAARRLAAADFIALVSWVTDELVEVTGCDPALVAVQVLRAPAAWLAQRQPAVLEEVAPRRLLPSVMLHAFAEPPAAACFVHSPASLDGDRGTSLLLVWRDATEVPHTIRDDPGFLQHLLVGRTPKARTSALSATAARLDAIMAHVPQGVIFVDDGRGEAIVNAAAAGLLSIPSGVVTRHQLADAMQQLFARLKNRDFVRKEATRIGADRSARIDDWSWELDDAEGTTLRVMSVPITHDAGHGRLWTFDDVSHERALLRQLARHRAFEEKLRQVQKLELVGRLAASVAHDFNNLLTIIAGSAEMLQDADFDTERRADLLNIEQATDRARRLTRQLLTFTRQQVEQSELFPIDDRLRETASLLTKVLAPSATLALQLGAAAAQVYTDPNQLELALLNLLANARDAMPDGGVVTLRTSIETLDGERVPGSVTPLVGMHVAIAVEDTGGGFDAVTAERMFEPFFTTKPAGQGTGLGLATVLAIAQRAGGGVRCTSVPGTGSCFTLLLPRAGIADARSPGADGADGAHDIERRFVLLVDDDPGPRDTLRRLLLHEGFTVEVAESGSVALRLLDAQGERCMAIITDYMMPQMTGRELLERVRLRWTDLPAIMISGFTPDNDLADMLARLQAAFLAKPFTGRQLATTIRQQVHATATVTAPPPSSGDPVRA